MTRPKKLGKYCKEKTMDDEELKEAYLRKYIKWQLNGVQIREPKSLKLFNLQDENN